MAAMAATQATTLLLLLVAASAAMAADTTHLNLFMHNIFTGSDPSAVLVVKGPDSSSTGLSFGDMIAIDNQLTENSFPTSTAVGRVQGFYMGSSQSGPVLTVCASLVLTSGVYNGSTIAIMGRLDDTPAALADASVRELGVVGGTGQFRKATGYVLWTVIRRDGPADATIELDVYVSTDNGRTIESASMVSGSAS